MENEKKRVYLAVPVLIGLIIFVAYFYSWDIGARLHPDEVCRDMATLTEKAREQIDQGKEHGSFYIQGIELSELDAINDGLCSINGNVKKYSVLEKSKHGLRIRLTYEISDNYYVYKRYTESETIPSDRAAAYKLYDEVCVILETIIKPDMTDYEKELAIHDYIVSNCEYGYTQNADEYAYRAYGALVQGKAVCNGYAEAMALLLKCAGICSDIVTGTAGGELHAWNIINLDGSWYQIDATWDDPLPDRGDFSGHMYFNVTDEIMADTHTWQKNPDMECTSWEYNYYNQNDLICDYEGFKERLSKVAENDKAAVCEFLVENYSESEYDMTFLSDIGGIDTVMFSAEPLGEYHLLTVRLNAKE